MEETKHAICCLGFNWFANYTAKNDLVDLSHSIYHLQLERLQNRTLPKCYMSCFLEHLWTIACIKDWLPTWHLLVQSQQCKHQDNVWNLFKINNKVTRMTSMTLLWCLYCQLLTDFTHCSTVSMFDFEQVNTSWEGLLKVFMIFSKVFQSLNLFQIKFPKNFKRLVMIQALMLSQCLL